VGQGVVKRLIRQSYKVAHVATTNPFNHGHTYTHCNEKDTTQTTEQLFLVNNPVDGVGRVFAAMM
jgi:hypothetical protein